MSSWSANDYQSYWARFQSIVCKDKTMMIDHKTPIATLVAAECLAQSLDKLGEELEKTNEFLEGAIDAMDKMSSAVERSYEKPVHSGPHQNQRPQAATTPKHPIDRQADPQIGA